MNHLQNITGAWLEACFVRAVCLNLPERGMRLIEESLELGQAIGVSEDQAIALVRYVFARPAGEVAQEIGGVAVTLGATAHALGLRVDQCWETELMRVIGRIDQIREKQAAKAAAGVVA